MTESEAFLQKHHWLELVVKGIAAAVGFISVVGAFYTAGPVLETKYWPAVGKLKVMEIKDNVTTVTMDVAFEKLRACEYIGISWFKVLKGVGDDKDTFERVPVVLGRRPGDVSSPNRPIGFQYAGPWTVGVTMDEFRQHSFAKLYHRCHPFWITETDFYP